MPKKTYFYSFFAHPSKASSAIMQQQGSKAKTPQKKGAHFFFGNPFFDQFFSKTLILHHPLKIVHQKISKNPYFYRLKKDVQVIDPTMARLSTLLWPKYGQVIDPTAYIYIYIVGSITCPHFGHFKVNNLATSRSITWPPFLSLKK